MTLTTEVLEAVRALERGETAVTIPLRWGRVAWRASTESVEGRCLDGMPFTITGISAAALVEWLRGEQLLVVLPDLDPPERRLLASGVVW